MAYQSKLKRAAICSAFAILALGAAGCGSVSGGDSAPADEPPPAPLEPGVQPGNGSTAGPEAPPRIPARTTEDIRDEEGTPTVRDVVLQGCDPDVLPNDLDWPPPAPSTYVALPRSLLTVGLGETPGLNDIGDRVDAALDAAGYTEKAYFTVGCDGWAVITRLERIGADGTPIEGQRFDPPEEGEPWSLTGYIARLFYAPPGYYRQIIFAATPRDLNPDDMAELEGRAQIDAIAEDGATERIALDETEAFSTQHELYALVYEFRADGEDNVDVRRPSPVNAASHLTRSGIYPELGDQD